MISIDGIVWDVPCDIGRVAEISPSSLSGMLLDKTYFNDVLGTFLTFDVTLAVPPTMEAEYYELYECLTDPVDAHRFVMPYNDGTVEITARVEEVRDELVYMVSRRQYWRGVEFTAIANHPSKTITLEEAQEQGVTPPPNGTSTAYPSEPSSEDDVQVGIGTVAEYTASGWVAIDNAEEVRY